MKQSELIYYELFHYELRKVRNVMSIQMVKEYQWKSEEDSQVNVLEGNSVEI